MSGFGRTVNRWWLRWVAWSCERQAKALNARSAKANERALFLTDRAAAARLLLMREKTQ